MGRYILRRVLQALPLLLLLSVLMFTLIHLMPGSAEQVIFNPHLSEAGREALRVRFGLDKPIYEQYLRWLFNSLTGDFGYSYSSNQPVMEVVSHRFPTTLLLFSFSLGFALIVAVTFGVVSAIRQNTIVDYTLTTLSYFGIAMPVFVLGLLLQDVFGVQLHLLPVSGTQTFGYTFDWFNSFLDRFLHMILPILTLSILYIAGWSRYMRASTIEVVKQDYMRTARAKGVSVASMLWRHAIRNAAIPLITVVAIDFGAVAAGATITEGIFGWPGLGQLFLNSLVSRDYPVLLAMLMLSGFFVVVFNLIADVLYGVMDPRIRYA